MGLKEFYSEINWDYEEVLSRLGKEDRILKYLKRFVDNDDYSLAKSTLSGKDYKEAFRHVHNIKGMSLNLGLGSLIKSSSELCEALRNGEPAVDISDMLAKIDEDYLMVVSAIKQIDE